MNAEPRFVTVDVLVVKQLEIDEPSWCEDDHDLSQFKQDITHNGRTYAASINTGRRAIEYLTAWITTAPFGIKDPQLLPLIAVELGGDIANFDPDELRDFTASARIHLAQLDALADTVEHLRGGGQ